MRASALFLLLAFLVQTGEGLNALACHEGSPIGAAEVVAFAHDHHDAHHGDAHHQDEDAGSSATPLHGPHGGGDAPCPMGTTPDVACGASATAPPPLAPTHAFASDTSPLRLTEPGDAADEALPLSHFRPPRA